MLTFGVFLIWTKAPFVLSPYSRSQEVPFHTVGKVICNPAVVGFENVSAGVEEPPAQPEAQFTFRLFEASAVRFTMFVPFLAPIAVPAVGKAAPKFDDVPPDPEQPESQTTCRFAPVPCVTVTDWPDHETGCVVVPVGSTRKGFAAVPISVPELFLGLK